MSRIEGLWHRARVLLRGPRYLREQDDELRFHLELDAMHRSHDGVPAAEIEHVVRRRIGNLSVLREELRRVAGFEPFDRLRQDVSYALRGLRRSPGFTIAVVATLGLGIGANAAMFSVIDRLMFRAPPMLRDPAGAHRLYLGRTIRGKEDVTNWAAYANYVDFARWTTSFSRFALIAPHALAVGGGADVREMQVGAVSAGFFDFFDAPPAIGRYFTATEDAAPAGTPVAVLSYAYWQVQFGGRRDVLGSTLRIGPLLYTVIGVSPAGFGGLWPDQPPVAYIPITSYAATLDFHVSDRWWESYSAQRFSVIAQRKPGVSIATANADLSQAYERSYEAWRAGNKRVPPIDQAKPHALAESILSDRGPRETAIAKVATWVSGVALIVLLIACANVANLLLTRALNRRREIAVRLALGVSRRRLISQLLTESVVLALLGGGVGLAIAEAASGALRAAFLPTSVSPGVASDPRTLVFAACVALAVGLLTGLAPALQLRHTDLTNDLKAGARDGSHRRSPVRFALLTLQGALAAMLLVGAGLFVRSLNNVRAVRLGYDVDPVVILSVNWRGAALDSGQKAIVLDRLLAATKAQPSVVSAAREASVPLWNVEILNLYIEGIDSVMTLGLFTDNAVSPDYFATLGTRIVRGRGISAEDRAGAPRAMVVSAAMAKRLWPNADPLGKCVRVGSASRDCTFVVGIAEDVRVMGLQGDPGYTYYLSSEQWHPEEGGVVIRTAGDGAHFAEALRRVAQREMPGASYVTVTPYRDVLGDMMRSWQLGASMFAVFGLLSLALATVGLFSVIAYNATQRTHEFGVRVALGAQGRDVATLMIGQGLLVSAAGLAIGVVVTLWAGRFVQPLLFDESPRDPMVFAVVAVSLLLAAVLASLIPALRATRVDPVQALRAE